MTENEHPASGDPALGAGIQTIVGSSRALPKGSQHAGEVSESQIIEASVYLRTRDEAAIMTKLGGIADPEVRRMVQANARTALYRDDLREVSDFVKSHGLFVTALAPARLLIRVAGSPSAIHAAFGVKLALYKDGSTKFRSFDGEIQLPEHLHALIESVLGLDSRFVAHTRIRQSHPAQSPSVGPNSLATRPS
ncbi:hypothetical protein HN018_25385 (plasmid) [Lichenicola cladoniae]|uniref:Peptidase S53 activation domain-containing protein n=1 Tax=Lichenicola cladoniae TaxID=1484109 RepID=A0A6M8HYT4_9PROT|nr:protease pro-enzyme activation domain-containing protein [Lichenicola cladoniae]NPD66804.1 hypothetical protein [Acetobacteraceae bacterium]QKE93500.1 hypothetical protein HN018_25385 [Lichenicola cladoniae]